MRANLPRQGIFNLNRFSITIKQLSSGLSPTSASSANAEGKEAALKPMFASEYRVRDALLVQVQDPIAREQEDTENLLLQLTEYDHAPYEFSK